MKKLITILSVLNTYPIFGQEGWIKHEIGNIDSIYIYLNVREFACIANEKWIAFEFENKSKDTIISERWCRYSIERNACGWSGNLTQEANKSIKQTILSHKRHEN